MVDVIETVAYNLLLLLLLGLGMECLSIYVPRQPVPIEHVSDLEALAEKDDIRSSGRP